MGLMRHVSGDFFFLFSVNHTYTTVPKTRYTHCLLATISDNTYLYYGRRNDRYCYVHQISARVTVMAKTMGEADFSELRVRNTSESHENPWRNVQSIASSVSIFVFFPFKVGQNRPSVSRERHVIVLRCVIDSVQTCDWLLIVFILTAVPFSTIH